MRIRFDKVSAHYGDGHEILHEFSFDDEVQALAVVGRSGCGKTTLLRVLGGLLVPQKGQVWVGDDALPREENALIQYRRRIGLVFQQGGLFAHLNARNNIARPLERVHGYTRQQSLDRADQLLSRFGLSQHGHKMPRALSGGQYQRIAIARAVASQAQLLLLDEPTSALDPAYTGEVLQMIEELKEAGTRFVIVTHELGFAARACQKVLMMDQGRIAEYGPSRETLSRPRTQQMRDFVQEAIHWVPG